MLIQAACALGAGVLGLLRGKRGEAFLRLITLLPFGKRILGLLLCLGLCLLLIFSF